MPVVDGCGTQSFVVGFGLSLEFVDIKREMENTASLILRNLFKC